MTKLCSTVRCSRLLHFFQISRVSRCTILFVVSTRLCSFVMCSLKASPSSVPPEKQLVNEAVDPQELRPRETENGDVDLISRSRDVDDDVWFGLEEALDRTLSATGSRTVCRNAMQNIGGQFKSNDVVNEVSLRKVNVPAVPPLKTSYLQLESYFKRSDVQFCVKECAGGVRDRALQRASRICRYLLCSSLLSAIVEIKSLLVAYGVPYGFLDLDRDFHSFEKNANTLGKSKKLIRTSFWIALTLLPWATYNYVQGRFGASVFEMKTFEPDSTSIIGLGRSKQAVEKHMSDLLAVSERTVDLERFYPAEFAGVECQLLVLVDRGPKRSVFKEPHEDLE